VIIFRFRYMCIFIVRRRTVSSISLNWHHFGDENCDSHPHKVLKTKIDGIDLYFRMWALKRAKVVEFRQFNDIDLLCSCVQQYILQWAQVLIPGALNKYPPKSMSRYFGYTSTSIYNATGQRDWQCNSSKGALNLNDNATTLILFTLTTRMNLLLTIKVHVHALVAVLWEHSAIKVLQTLFWNSDCLILAFIQKRRYTVAVFEESKPEAKTELRNLHCGKVMVFPY